MFAVAAELSHQAAESCDLRFQLAGGGGIRRDGCVTEDDEARGVPSGDARRASGVTCFLTPTVFRSGKAVVAGNAIEFRVLRPGRTAGPASQTLQAIAQLHALAYGPFFCAEPRGLRGFLPVARHHRAEQIQLEGQIRMSGGDHLVIDEFFRSAHVTAQAGVAADSYIVQIDHPKFRLLLGRLILPTLDRVRPQPARSRTMATLATDAVVQFKRLGALLG